MATSLKEALSIAGVDLTPEEELQEQEEREAKHRLKKEMSRPTEEFDLKAYAKVPFERKKYQLDPTPDLIELPGGTSTTQVVALLNGNKDAYLIWCADTYQMWLAPSKLCLDTNFIWRQDLEIISVNDPNLDKFVMDRIAIVNPGIISRKRCYILDNPAAETYEVYYESNYPSLRYGKATPNGMFIHSYNNRFHRDMAIMELDQLYSDSSKKKASDLTKKELKANEAIIVSDGAWMQNVCSYSFYYLDSMGLTKQTQAMLPSEVDQAVLISEISGAYAALKMCYDRKKTRVKYYYDNTSILNVFRNRKTEYIREIVDYKKLLEDMNSAGFQVEFIELHPKTGEDRVNANKALMFFHNYCDKECREMCDVFAREYTTSAIQDSSTGKSYADVKKEYAPKGRPGQSGNGGQNNSRNGNNRYGRRF